MGRPLRILFLVQPGNVSREIFHDAIRGFERAGHQCLRAELAPIWAAFEANPGRRAQVASEATGQVSTAIRAQRIDLTVAMWSNALSTLMHQPARGGQGPGPGRVIPCFEAMTPPCPHLMYWLDAPQWAQSGSVPKLQPSGLFASRWLFSVVNNEAIAEEMRRVMGFAHARGMPYGVCEETFKPSPWAAMGEREFDLAFALGPGDAPPTDAMREELERDRPDVMRIRADLARGLGLEALVDRAPSARRDGVRRLLQGLVERQLSEPHRPMLERLDALVRQDGAAEMKDGAEALLADCQLFIDASAQIRRIDSWRRAFTFVFLARQLRCVLFGGADLAAAGWGELAAGGGGGGKPGVTWLGHVPHTEQAAVYSRARLGLSVMRWQDDVGVNLKPFEITASGAAALVGRRVGLEDLWAEDEEIVVFSDPGEALTKARRLLDEPERLERIAATGRARTLRDHTWRLRCGQILAEVGRGCGQW